MELPLLLNGHGKNTIDLRKRSHQHDLRVDNIILIIETLKKPNARDSFSIGFESGKEVTCALYMIGTGGKRHKIF